MGGAIEAECAEVAPFDDAAIEEIAGKNEAAKESVQYLRGEALVCHVIELFPGVLEVVQEIPINPVVRVKKRDLLVEEFTRFDGEEKLTQSCRHAVNHRDKARQPVSRLRISHGAAQSGIDMDLVRRNQHENRCTTVVPELLVKTGNLGRRELRDLLEINERRVVGAENAVQIQEIEGSAQNVGLRNRAIEVILARKETRRHTVVDAEFLLPI
ncbi:MAG: hypothetical protein WBX00_26320 [Isosphaeraceae bacterium]